MSGFTLLEELFLYCRRSSEDVALDANRLANRNTAVGSSHLGSSPKNSISCGVDVIHVVYAYYAVPINQSDE